MVKSNIMIPQYIFELLNANERIIIPNFGALIKREGNTTDSVSITFSPFLKYNDGLLLTHITQKENITKEAAQDKLDTFVKELKIELNSKKSFEITNLGTFTIDEKGNLNFITMGKITKHTVVKNESQDTVKEKSTKIQKIITKPTTTTMETSNNRKKSILLLSILSVIIILLLFFSLNQLNIINIFNREINPKTPINKTIEKTEAKIIDEYKIVSDNNTSENNSSTETINPLTGEQFRFYIIAGSFIKKNNATRFAEKLKKLTFEGKIIFKENNFYSVSQESFTNLNQAKTRLEVLKKKQSDLWILKY